MEPLSKSPPRLPTPGIFPFSRNYSFLATIHRGKIILTDDLAVGYRWILAGCILAGAASFANLRNRTD
jgi:hypothetical protein